MADGLKKTDLAEKDLLANLIPTPAQLQLVDQLDKKYQSLATTLKSGLNNSKDSVAAMQKQSEIQKQLTAATKKKAETDKERLRLEQQLRKSTDEEVKGRLRLQKANAVQRKELKSLIDLEQTEVGTLARLRAENKALTIEREKLNLSTEKGVKRAREINAALDANNKKIKENTDQLGRNRLNVGNYAESIIEAETALRKERDQLEKNTRALKIAAAQTDKNENQQNEIQKELKETEERYKQVNIQLNQYNITQNNSTNVMTRSEKVINKVKKSFLGLKNVIGSLGLIVGVSTIFRNLTGVIVEYNQAQTDLIAITQKSEEELAGLTEQARQLGATTQFSATEITGLQIELAKLGFTTQEIMDSTGGIANFAAATGVEIPRAAKLAGSALRAFGLDATEIDRVVSTLGVATTKTALDFSQLETGLSTVAPVAASFGFSIEDTTALLGQLSNAGFDASSAATATRNILLNLADANGDLAKQLGRPVKNAEDLTAGLQKLQAQGIDLADALELTDKRSVAAFSTFISGSDSLVKLRDDITDVNDELDKMAADRLTSISGQMKLVNSAWEEYILKTDEAFSISSSIAGTLGFVANNLETIVTVIIGGLRAWALQTLAVKLYRTEVNSAGVAVSRGLIPNIIKSGKALLASVKGFKLATFSAKGFGAALKSIPFVGIISSLFTLVSLFDDNTSSVDANTDAKIDNADATEDLNVKLEEQRRLLVEINKQLEEGSTKIGELSTENLKNLTAEYEKNLDKTQSLVDLYNIQDESLKKSGDALQDYLVFLLNTTDITNDGIQALYDRRDALLNLAKAETELAKRGEESNKRREKTNNERVKSEKKEIDQSEIAEQEAFERKQQRDKDIANQEKENEQIREENADAELERIAKINDAQEKADEDRLKREQEELEKEKERQNELVNLRQETQKQITDGLISQIDRRVSALQQEANARGELTDYLKGLAESGNVTAQQSLKEQIIAQREAEKELIEIEKRKATIQLVTTGLNTFSAEIDRGKTPAEALASTIVSAEALKAVLSGMNFFATGTDYAPEGVAVVDEKGAEIHLDKQGNIKSLGSDKGANFRHLERGDKIIPHDESKNILSYISKINRPKEMLGNSARLESANTIKELKNISNILKSKNDSANYDPLFNELVRRSTNNGVRIKNRYKS
jgi:TP901 family phage tail tape measure protein